MNAVMIMLVRRPENPRLIQSSHFCSSRSPVRSLRATLLSGGVRQRIETKTGTTRKEIQSATRMFRWNPSAVAPDPNPETIRSKKRQTISPTLRMWSRFSGVSGCQGFRRRRSHQDGQSSNATPTAAKRSKAIGATIAKYIFDTPLSEALALGVVDFEVAEEGGLWFDLGAVADDYDLHVCGVEIFAGGFEQIGWRECTDFLAIGFEIVFGQFVQCHHRDLREQTVLRRETHGEDAAQIILSVGQFGFRNRQGTQLVHFVEDFRERCSDDVVANRRRNRKVAVLPQGADAAPRAVRVALVFANVHHQPRIECAAVQTVGQAELDPIGMLARDGVASCENLRLHRARQMHQMDATPARICRSRENARLRLLPLPRAEHFFDRLEHRVRLKIANEQQHSILRRIEIGYTPSKSSRL